MAVIKTLIILIIYSFCCLNIYETNTARIKRNFIEVPLIKEEKPIGNIYIKKININKPLYNINSDKNNIEENITILPGTIGPDQKNSILFLAAHSGPDEIAFFDDLDQLKINDTIELTYNNIKYNYIIKDIWETKKDGSIEVIKEDSDQLILTTCSKNSNKQLIINSTKIESH